MGSESDDPGKPPSGKSPLGFTAKLVQADRWCHLIHLPGLKFVQREGALGPQSWTITHTTVRIGSHTDNDIVLRDPAVSRFHVQVLRDQRGVRLRDLGSTNGTFLRGAPVLDVYLAPGDEFSVGNTALMVEPSESQIATLPSPAGQQGPFIGRSPALGEAYSLLRAAACTSASVVVLGESGTGKELAARFLHAESRRTGPLITFDCGRIQPDLVQSELFGHVRGAFTGADKDRPGAIRQAHRGTLFLDELGELPLALQSFLLRVLESREVQSLGSDSAVPVDVRVVAATNRDLGRMVKEGTFREDLYYRLGVVLVTLPSLRERREDIPLLIHHFIKELGLALELSPEAVERLSAHAWPGNVRALRNTLERLNVTCGRRVATPRDLDFLAPSPAAEAPGPGLPTQVAAIERKTILETYERMKRNKLRTARALGISRNTLKRRLEEYQIDEE